MQGKHPGGEKLRAEPSVRIFVGRIAPGRYTRMMATRALASSIGERGNNSNQSSINWEPLLSLFFVLPACIAVESLPKLVLCVSFLPFYLLTVFLWPRPVCVQP